MTTTLVLTQSLLEQLEGIANIPVETAGVLLVSVVKPNHGSYRLLAREYHPVPDGAYIHRSVDALTIASEGYIAAIARAEAIGATALWLHTHPGIDSSPAPSKHDEEVDRQLSETFRLRSGSDYYGALILSPRKNSLCFTGHVSCDRDSTTEITRIWAVGSRLKLLHSEMVSVTAPLAMFDRNIRAFGPDIQKTLGSLVVGIVGCGGTGSAIAEQLVRLGVRGFVLVDPDTLSVSNVTRVYGSTPADVGRAKVNVLARHIKDIAPESVCEIVQSMLTIQTTAQHLLSCDIVFGCTDDNAGRLVLSRIPTYLLTPVIDCGVLLSSNDGGELIGIDGRVTIVSPTEGCLLCRNRIDVARAGAELLTPAERTRREDEGYAPALGQTEPAVVTFTSMVGAIAVSELLERLIGYGPSPRPNEILLRFHEREISTNIATPRAHHYCHAAAGKLGLGITDPFLELAWPR